MNSVKTTAANCHQYQIEIAIDAPCERVWKALIEETNHWWLPDFHVVGAGSVVTFDPFPGGRGLVEGTEDGGGLLWYSVHMYMPGDFKIFLIGHLAPDWGGPSTSSLELALQKTDSGCKLIATEARHGNVDEKSVQSTEAGWMQLFTEGLKKWVEDGAI